MIPQYIKSDRFPFAYKLLTVALFVGALLPEYLALIVPLAVFVSCVVGNKPAPLNIKTDRIPLAMSVYAVYLALTAFWSASSGGSVYNGFVWICAALCVMIVVTLADTREKIENILLCLVGTAAANSVVGIIQMSFMAVGKSELFPNPLYSKLDAFVYELFKYDYFVEEVRDRVAACFENPLIFATFLVMIFPVAAYFCFYGATKKRRIYSVVCSGLIFFGLLFTFLRGAAIAIIVSFMVLSFAGKKPAKFMSGAATVSSLIIFITIFERRGVSASQDLSTNYRIELWKSTFGLIKENLLFGVGASSVNVKNYLFSNGMEFSHSHNLFIEILAEGGIIGFAIFAVLCCVFIADFINLCKMNGWHRSYAIALLSSFSGFAVMSMFDHTLCTPKQIFCFAVLAGCLQAIKRISVKINKE